MTKKDKKLPFEIGEVVIHKVDSRRMVIIGYEYKDPTSTRYSLSVWDPIARPQVKKKGKEVEKIMTGVTCRFKNMHNELSSGNFLVQEFTKLEKTQKNG